MASAPRGREFYSLQARLNLNGLRQFPNPQRSDVARAAMRGLAHPRSSVFGSACSAARGFAQILRQRRIQIEVHTFAPEGLAE